MGRFKIFQRKKDGFAVETGSQQTDFHAQVPAASKGAHCPVAELEKRVEKLGDRVYCAVGYALSNVTMVAVEGGNLDGDDVFDFQETAPEPVTELPPAE